MPHDPPRMHGWRSFVARRRLGRLGETILVAGVIWLISAGPAATAATGGPMLTGTVAGGLHRGGVAVFRLRATEPGGYQRLETLRVTMVLHDLVLAQVTYLADFQSV